MTLNQQLLHDLIGIVWAKVEAHHTEVGEVDWDRDYDLYRRTSHAADDRLKEFFSERYDARFTGTGDCHTVTMAGIRATSIGGWVGALLNWKRAAENKLGADEAATDELLNPARKGAMEAQHRDGFNPYGSGPVPIEPREG